MAEKKIRFWENHEDYGLLFKKRASGELPEMESSKALSKVIKENYSKGEKILDAGCGSGHYLRSLIKANIDQIKYTGCDVTEKYINFAKEIDWTNDQNIETFFEVQDIENLTYKDDSFDISYCSNVILHLFNPAKAIKSLARVTKKVLLLRTLVADRNYIVKGISNTDDDNQLSDGVETDSANNFCYYNFFSKKQIKSWIFADGKKGNLKIWKDEDYNIKNLKQDQEFNKNINENTSTIENTQFTGPIRLDWYFVLVKFD